MTKQDLVNQLGLDKFTFDYSLPQGMVDQVYADTGYYLPEDFVYVYAKNYEGPVAITERGRARKSYIEASLGWNLKDVEELENG